MKVTRRHSAAGCRSEAWRLTPEELAEMRRKAWYDEGRGQAVRDLWATVDCVADQIRRQRSQRAVRIVQRLLQRAVRTEWPVSAKRTAIENVATWLGAVASMSSFDQPDKV